MYRAIIFPVVFCGCETWSLTLREGFRLRVFENRVLRRIFESKRDKITGQWKKLRNGELNDLYLSPNIVLVIKSKRMRWAGHVATMVRGVVSAGFCWGTPRERDHLGEPGVNGRVILNCNFRKLDLNSWIVSSWLRIGTCGGQL